MLNVNSTATGGGVAEMLQTLLAYARGAGIDARWLVIEGDPEFFAITKRIHNGLYGAPGDGGAAGRRRARALRGVLRRNADELLALVRPGDVVVAARSPAGGAGGRAARRRRPGRVALPRRAATTPNEWTERAWEFLRPYLEEAEAFVVSRAAFAPPWADPADARWSRPRSTPSRPRTSRSRGATRAWRSATWACSQGDGEPPVVPFARRDGSPGRINRHADVLQSGPPPPPDAPLVIQASRWDRMKDMAGRDGGLRAAVDPALGRAPRARRSRRRPAWPTTPRRPTSAGVRRGLAARCRTRCAAASTSPACRWRIPTRRPRSSTRCSATRRSIAQKSLAEGFGLTVAEAMWKARPVVASAVGGIVDQIVHGEHGLLVDDPHDLAAFGAAVEALLRDPAEAGRLGRNGRRAPSATSSATATSRSTAGLFAQLGDARQTL